MKRTRLLGLVAVGLVACSSKPAPIGPHATTSAGSGTTTATTGAGGAGGSTGSAGGGGVGGAGGSGGAASTTGAGGAGGAPTSLGDLPIENVDDTACVAPSVAPVVLYPGAGDPIPLDRLSRVGTRWLGAETLPYGFVTFDLDGSSPSPAPATVEFEYNVAASEGPTIGGAGATGAGSIVYQRYAPDLTPVGPVLDVAAEEPTNLAIGGDAGASLVVWGAMGVLRARGVDANDAFAGPSFDFGQGTVGGYFRGSVAGAGDGTFGIAWTGEPNAGDYQTYFARATTTALSSGPVAVLASTPEHRVADLARAGSGWVVLLDAKIQGSSDVIVRLDDAGNVVGTGKRLLGADYGWAIAATADSVAIVAKRKSGEAELRILDASLEPKGPWICVTEPSNDLFHTAAVAPDDGGGWAVVTRTPAGDEELYRLDASGSPSP